MGQHVPTAKLSNDENDFKLPNDDIEIKLSDNDIDSTLSDNFDKAMAFQLVYGTKTVKQFTRQSGANANCSKYLLVFVLDTQSKLQSVML